MLITALHGSLGNPLQPAEEVLTVYEVAAMLRCSACTVRRLGYRGVLRTYRIAGSTLVRYYRTEVLALLERRSGAA